MTESKKSTDLAAYTRAVASVSAVAPDLSDPLLPKLGLTNPYTLGLAVWTYLSEKSEASATTRDAVIDAHSSIDWARSITPEAFRAAGKEMLLAKLAAGEIGQDECDEASSLLGRDI